MTYTRHGHDVSYYQASINFQAMQASGAEFVIIRCGYNVTEDLHFDQYMFGVEGILPHNVYHFYDPNYPPLQQAASVIKSLEPYRARITRVWMDLEFDWLGSYQSPGNWLIYRNAINAAGYKTGIYTRATWWDGRVGAYAAEFGRDPFWVAQYASALTLIPKGAKAVLIWQSGSPYYSAGQQSPRIDYDLWNDGYSFENEWTSSPLPPTGDPMFKYTATALADATRLRPASNVNQTYIGSYPAGTKFNGDVLFIAAAPLVVNQITGDTWLQVTEIVTPAEVLLRSGWVAITHLGKMVCSLVENVVTPPPAGDTIVTVTVNEQAKTVATTVKWADGTAG